MISEVEEMGFLLDAIRVPNGLDQDQARGYKTFFMLNSTEHEISTAHKHLNTDK